MAEPTTTTGAFSKFMQLPKELRDSIWAYALPEDVPELLFYDGPELLLTDERASSVLVNTGYPALMHVCAESRAVARRETYFEFSRDADAEVPRRRFRPELDVQHLTVWDAEDAAPGPGCRHVTGLGIMQMRYQWMCAFETHCYCCRHAVGDDRGLLDDHAPGTSRSPGPRYRSRVRFVDVGSLLLSRSGVAETERFQKMEQYMHNVYKARCEIDPSLDPDSPRPHFRMGVFEMWLKDSNGSPGWHPADY
ncbi:hypothetical protein PG997_013341 [Apiospora hydei]|uniref:2EXR domain-containing protein n=1 Tax=Apiospora hydei TaxID=1337664 RepID=A0ABR1V5X3_9PEZI